MSKYQTKYNKIIISDSEEERQNPINKYPSYQVTREHNFTNIPSNYQKSHYYSKKVQYGGEQYNNRRGKQISSISEKNYNILTEASQPKVNFVSKNTAKRYMDKKAYTPSRIVKNNFDYEEYQDDNGYFTELRDDFQNRAKNNRDRVIIKRMIYRGNQTPQHYRSVSNEHSHGYEYGRNDEEYLENYGYHESKNIRGYGDKKYESITYVNGYSNLIPMNKSAINERVETYNYTNQREQETEPRLVDAIEKVRELQRGKREYDEFMRKLGTRSQNDGIVENYRKEKIREEKFRMDRIRQEKMKGERIKKEKLQQMKIREEKARQDKIKRDKLKQNQEKAKSKSKSKAKTIKIQKIKVNTETSGKRNDVFKKEFKAHAGRYRYKDNINEEIEHYRNKSTYNLNQLNVGRKETVYKNQKIQTTKSYTKLPIKTNIKIDVHKYTSSTKNNLSKNLLKPSITNYSTKTDINKSSNKNYTNKSYQIKTTKTTTTTSTQGGRKNSYRASNASSSLTKKIPNQPKKVTSSTISSNYSKKSYISHNQNYMNNNYRKNQNQNNYIQKIEKTDNLHYSQRNNLIDTYEPNYENNFDREGEKEYLTSNNINIESYQKILDENDYDNNKKFEIYEESKKINKHKYLNSGDNYAFYESKHLLRPDNNSYTIHERYGGGKILEKNYGTRIVRHYEVPPEEDKRYFVNSNNTNRNNNNNLGFRRENNIVEYRRVNINNNNLNSINTNNDFYGANNYELSPDEGEGEGIYEKRVEEYNYESRDGN